MTRHTGRPSVLAVTSELPWPLDRGGHLRTFHLLRALASANRVRLIEPSSDPDEGAVRALRDAGIELRAVRVARRRQATEALRVAHATVAAEPYVLYRRHRWSAVRAALRLAVAQDPPDVCYLDHLDSFVYAGACASTPIVIDLHNVYSELAARSERDAMAGTLLFNAAHYALRPWPWILVALASMLVFPRIEDIRQVVWIGMDNQQFMSGTCPYGRHDPVAERKGRHEVHRVVARSQVRPRVAGWHA